MSKIFSLRMLSVLIVGGVISGMVKGAPARPIDLPRSMSAMCEQPHEYYVEVHDVTYRARRADVMLYCSPSCNSNTCLPCPKLEAFRVECVVQFGKFYHLYGASMATVDKSGNTYYPKKFDQYYYDHIMLPVNQTKVYDR